MYDIVALGEILIDFTPSAYPKANEIPAYLQNPGGAPANVLAMSTKQGRKTAFIGKVGKDYFGNFLEQTLRKEGIDVAGLCCDAEHPTTLAFVQLGEGGERAFSFYRKGCADVQLSISDVPEKLLASCRIFHFGSVSMTEEPCRSATLLSAQRARKEGALISFDPNLRPLLWKDLSCARNEIQNAIPLCDLLKVSEEELAFLLPGKSMEEGAEELRSMGPVAVVVTLGEKGAYYQTGSVQGYLPAYSVEAVDTTGAGDAFWGMVLSFLSGKSREEICCLDKQSWEKIIRFANAAGGLTTRKKGAIPAMPDAETVRRFVEEHC